MNIVHIITILRLGGIVLKRISSLIIIVFLLLIGCSKDNSNLYSFDKSKLSSQLKDASFQPKLPTKLPFKVKSTSVNILETQRNVMSIFIAGKNKEQMDLQIIKGKVSLSDDLKRAKVKINSHKGNYVKNNAGTMILDWDDSGIHYSLAYSSKLSSGKKISKEALIDTAKSFK